MSEVTTDRPSMLASIPGGISAPTSGQGASPEDLRSFTWHLGTLLSAGLPLDHGLAVIQNGFEDPRLRRTVGDLRACVREGLPLSIAVGHHPDCFSETFRTLVQVGETTGLLAEMIRVLGHFQAGSARLRSLFAVWLIDHSIGYALIWGGLTWMFLSAIDVWGVAGGEYLPVSTWGTWTLQGLVLSPAVFFLVLAVCRGLPAAFLREGQANSLLVDRVLLQVPVLGPLYCRHLLGRAMRVLHILLASGVPLSQALEAAADGTPHSLLRLDLRAAMQRVRHGDGLAVALDSVRGLTPLARSMIRSGEENGDLTDVLAWLSGFYEREVEGMSARVATVLLPLGRFIHGAILGGSFLAVAIPILSVPGF